MSRTIICATCNVALHPSDEYSEEGCPMCGGEIHSPEVRKVQIELEELATKDEELF